MKKLITTAFLCFSTLAMAGDAAKLTHIGFSTDGKNYAYMESGIQDGSGFAYAQIKFLDTLNNKHNAAAVSVIQEDEDTVTTLADIESRALSKASEALKTLSISTNVKGDVLVSRKITDLEARALKEVSFSNGPIIGGLTAPTYKLKLSLSKATPVNADACLIPGQAKKLKLELIDLKTKKATVLQEDTKLPASRGCAHNYEIEDVVVMDSKIVVLLRVFTPGFEGEDVRFMAVSGALVQE